MIKLTTPKVSTQMTQILEIARINTDLISKSVVTSDARMAVTNRLYHQNSFAKLFIRYYFFK